MKKINIYSNGIVHCSVCVDSSLIVPEIEELVNQENMTGINSKWKVSKENFKDGSPNPNKCEDDKNRKHYLMVC